MFCQATRASKSEVENKWARFVARIDEEHYTRDQIRKAIHNLDKKKQYSALHYAVWHNNIYLVEKLLAKKSKFSSGNYRRLKEFPHLKTDCLVE